MGAGGLSAAQRGLLVMVVELCDDRGAGAVRVVSEWDGYLPVPVSIAIEGVPWSRSPAPWDSGDLDALIAAGYLALIEQRTSSDGLDRSWTIRPTESGRAVAAAPGCCGAAPGQIPSPPPPRT